MNIAVIPARGGSKRVPRKNVKQFCGKPIIAWSIEAAIKSALFDQVIVSTDDDEIAEIAKNYGAEVPFIRPKKLADDYEGTRAVMKHTADWLIEQGQSFNFICKIYATAAFIQPTDLIDSFKLLQSSHAEMAFSATNFDFPIQRAVRITQNGRVEMVQSEFMYSRSQDLDEMYHDAGQFYWFSFKAVLNNLAMFSEHSIPILLPRYRVQDIDTDEDWQRAELMFQCLNTK